jgi:hypothetical protein
MVEFSLIAPLLFFLIFGVIDLGRAVYFQIELNNAARDGARVAILASNPCNEYVGNNGCTGDESGLSGTSVCQAITHDTTMISTFNDCNDLPNGTGFLSSTANCTASGACSGNAGQAYIEINQYDGTSATPTCLDSVYNPGTSYTTKVPRSAGNLPVQVKIIYFYRPLTPLLGSLFPTNFYLYSAACARPEY